MLEAWPRRGTTLLVGIDGEGGSGKTTLSASLAALSSISTVVHMDDFYRLRSIEQPATISVGDLFDWARLQAQVLGPLSRNVKARYQRYDWGSDSLAEWVEVEPGGVVMVEGVSTTRRELRGDYDLRIYVDCPPSIRLKRGLERDGEAARSMWRDVWMPAEERYLEDHKPSTFAHIVVDGSGRSGSNLDGCLQILKVLPPAGNRRG